MSSGLVDISGCYFSNNISTSSGGAIMTLDSDIRCIGSYFNWNESNYHGGAVKVEDGFAYFDSVEFRNNSTYHSGSGLYLLEHTMTL